MSRGFPALLHLRRYKMQPSADSGETESLCLAQITSKSSYVSLIDLLFTMKLATALLILGLTGAGIAAPEPKVQQKDTQGKCE